MKNFWVFFILLGVFGLKISFYSYAINGDGSGVPGDLPGSAHQVDRMEYPEIDVLISKLNKQSSSESDPKSIITEIPENIDYLILKDVLEDGNLIDSFKALYEHFKIFSLNYTHPNLTTLVKSFYMKIYSSPALPDAIRALAFLELEAIGIGKDSRIKIHRDSQYFFDLKKEDLDVQSRNLWSSALVFTWNRSVSVLSIHAEENGYRILDRKELTASRFLVHKKKLGKYRLKSGDIINLSGEVQRIEVRYNLSADGQLVSDVKTDVDGEIEMTSEEGQSLELRIDGIQDIYIQNEQTTNG